MTLNTSNRSRQGLLVPLPSASVWGGARAGPLARGRRLDEGDAGAPQALGAPAAAAVAALHASARTRAAPVAETGVAKYCSQFFRIAPLAPFFLTWDSACEKISN
jgi:hypothetical protein